MIVIIKFLLKVIATFFAGIIGICCILMALILWDMRFMNIEDGRTFIWE